MATLPAGVTVRDAKGQTGRTRIFVTNQGAGTGLDIINVAGTNLVNLLALSNGQAISTFGAAAPGSPAGLTVSPFGYGANAVYEDSADKAIMVFADAAGYMHRFQVPCPKTAIFKADGETVDSANALVSTFTTGMLAAAAAAPNAANVTTKDGRALSAFIGGYRLRRRQTRRINIFVKSSDLATPAL